MGRRSKVARARHGARRRGRRPDAPQGFGLFIDRFPSLGESETRVMTFLHDVDGIPAGEYAFAESFCVKPDCDCRRAKFVVLRRRPGEDRPRHVLTIGYGWETPAFYTRWMGDSEISDVLSGAIIEPGGPQPAWADVLLREFSKTSLASPDYVQRVVRHYQLYRESTG